MNDIQISKRWGIFNWTFDRSISIFSFLLSFIRLYKYKAIKWTSFFKRDFIQNYSIFKRKIWIWPEFEYLMVVKCFLNQLSWWKVQWIVCCIESKKTLSISSERIFSRSLCLIVNLKYDARNWYPIRISLFWRFFSQNSVLGGNSGFLKRNVWSPLKLNNSSKSFMNNPSGKNFKLHFHNWISLTRWNSDFDKNTFDIHWNLNTYNFLLLMFHRILWYAV